MADEVAEWSRTGRPDRLTSAKTRSRAARAVVSLSNVIASFLLDMHSAPSPCGLKSNRDGAPNLYLSISNS